MARPSGLLVWYRGLSISFHRQIEDVFRSNAKHGLITSNKSTIVWPPILSGCLTYKEGKNVGFTCQADIPQVLYRGPPVQVYFGNAYCIRCARLVIVK